MILSSFDHLTLYLVLPQRRTGSFIKGILFKISRIFVFRETASSTDGALTRKLSRIFYRLFSFSFLHFSFFFSLSPSFSLRFVVSKYSQVFVGNHPSNRERS